jgi:hypothetical protein
MQQYITLYDTIQHYNVIIVFYLWRNYRFLYFSSWRKVQNESFTATYEQLPTDRNPNVLYILIQDASL